MAFSQSNVSCPLKEWAPLTELLAKLPTKSQSGLFFQDIKITCIDVLAEFIALGTNVGIVYWFDRNKRDMQRLRCENTISITALKVISTVDYMVACGNITGNISIFQIPKSYPDNLPESLKPKNKQVERYTVQGLHKAAISAIDWSKNGMKLFSGDKNGCIVLTEIDFYMHICKSVEILNESYEVVQLSFNKQRLLVSTTFRSIICQKQEKWKVSQVGTKERKVLGSFGGLIHQFSEKPLDICLYCTRPGLRIWIADVEGNVQKTLLFKELITKDSPEVPLINPISINLEKTQPPPEPSFGILLPYSENLLVTYSNNVIYILDPKELIVVTTVRHLRGILDVAIHKDEIFILEGDRSVIRISSKPDANYAGSSFQSAKESFLPLSSLKDFTSKLQSTNIITAIPLLGENSSSQDLLDVQTDETLVMNAEEAQESPVEAGPSNVDTQQKFEEIGKKKFEDNILFKKSRRRKNKSKPVLDTSTNSVSSNSSEEKEANLTRPTIMNLSSVGVLPDLRSPESIKYDIEYKEKLLAEYLNLDHVKLLHIDDGDTDKSDDESIDQTKTDQEEAINKPSTSKVENIEVIDDLDQSTSETDIPDTIESDDVTPGEATHKGLHNYEDNYHYEILSTDDIVRYMLECVKEVNVVVQIPATITRILLSHFNWDKEKFMEKFFDSNQDELFKSAHVVNPFKKPCVSKRKPTKSPAATEDCEICYNSFPFQQMTGLECGHRFCLQCWNDYLTTKIMDEGMGQTIECAAHNCPILVDDQTAMRLITDIQVKLRYQHLITNNFVECNRILKWCPAPNCNYAIKVHYVEAKPVTCLCGNTFCFACCETWHEPVMCHLLKKWQKKCDSDSETSNWIAANTKECPRCNATIEKDGGCNHMICKNQNCKADFCWVCLGPWEPHGSLWYNCNRYNEDEAKAARDAQEKSRAALQRYLFYCNRYMNHMQSLKFEHKLYALAKEKMEEMQRHNMSWIEVQFLKKAVDTLCKCRQTLMYTYVFAYYLKKNNQSVIFEENQKDLVRATELLSEYLERDITQEDLVLIKQKVQDKYRYCDGRRMALLDHVHEGYEKDWWIYCD